ncbi:MAG TPA: hypothetical protein VGB11_00145 [Candidatus Bathyarchaeia archaeon]
MKKLLTKICVSLVIALIATSLEVLSAAYSAQAAVQDQATAFIENVLPVDLSKYTVTLKNQINDGVTDLLLYTLDSDESTLRATCLFKNNALLSCNLYVDKGQVISNKQYVNIVDAAKSVLEKYQTYTKIDSATMIAMLDNVDATKDSSTMVGNINFTKYTIIAYGIEVTTFRWAYTVNGAEYTKLGVEFQNGIFSSLYDTRSVYSIGDTTVNISREQAIDIAMKYSETYSYAMPSGSQVSGFNITEDRSTAKLVTYPINSTVLRPYWHVELYLNQTYPGYVEGLTIYVWANSGEVFLCSNIAYGGADYSDTDNSGSELPDTSPSSSSENSVASVDISTIAIVAVAVAVVVIAASALFIKKRSK